MRRHREWRCRLFTPFGVQKGPKKGEELASTRITTGVTKGGREFTMIDDWTLEASRHKRMSEELTGGTKFTQKGIIDGDAEGARRGMRTKRS